MIQMSAEFGVEEFEVMFADGPKVLKADVYTLAVQVSDAYTATADKGIVERTAALNAIYGTYGMPPLGPVAADKLASLISQRGIDLKNDVWATPNGDGEPGLPATTPG